nr:MAG TPA: hypothetical protein [Caudoviricetes sp.]
MYRTQQKNKTTRNQDNVLLTVSTRCTWSRVATADLARQLVV